MGKTPKEFRIRMQGPTDIQIGKAGLTSQLTYQINILLKRYSLVKIRVLRNAPPEQDTQELADASATSTNSQVGIVRGNCFLLYTKNWKNRIHHSLVTTYEKKNK